MSRFPQSLPSLRGLPCYIPGEAPGTGTRFRLASNENPYGCSALAQRALRGCIEAMPVYPDGSACGLRQALGEKFSLEPERIICGAGSDDIFQMLVRSYVGLGERVVQSRHGFLMYGLLARQAGGVVVLAQESEYRMDVDALLECACEGPARLVFIANPNNPTGSWLKGREVERLLAGLSEETILVLDGAYAEYVTDRDYDCGFELARAAENVVVTRTFSKIHGLAGLRVGWGYASLSIVESLHKVRLPFNVSVVAQACALASLSDDVFVEESSALNARGRERLFRGLEGLGLAPVSSEGNFVSANFGIGVNVAREFLLERGISVRGLESYGLPEHLRITVGTDEAVEAVLLSLQECIG